MTLNTNQTCALSFDNFKDQEGGSCENQLIMLEFFFLRLQCSIVFLIPAVPTAPIFPVLDNSREITGSVPH